MALAGLLADYGDENGSGSISSTEKRGKTIASLRAPIFVERELLEEFSEWKMIKGSVGRNIMTVEFAMQRELTYRKKIETLQPQPPNGFQEPPMPAHKIVGHKRKSPSGNVSFLPPQHPRQAYRHQPLHIQPVNLFCKECNVLCSGEYNLKQHYKGKKHQFRLEELARQKNGGKTENGLLWCEVCKIPCMNEFNFQEHISGKKHILCLQAINNTKSRRGEASIEENRSGRQFLQGKREP